MRQRDLPRRQKTPSSLSRFGETPCCLGYITLPNHGKAGQNSVDFLCVSARGEWNGDGVAEAEGEGVEMDGGDNFTTIDSHDTCR